MGTQASPENHTPPKDERTAWEKAIDDRLPITSSRKAKWWYSAFHNVTAMVGAGMLSLPYAMSELGCYQIYAMPVFDMMETVLVKKMNFPPGLTLRLITRTVYVAFTMFVGITFPFFGGLIGFFGGLAFAPTTYFLPCIMWLAHHLQAQEIQPLMVHQLDLYRPWGDSDGRGAHRRAQADHHFCQDIQVLLIDHSLPPPPRDW